MTVTSQISRNDYNGNGVTTQFPVTYRFLDDSHLKVLRTVIATGVATTLTLNAVGADGYTVAGAGQPSGGAVTLNVAAAIGTRLSILRNVPATQEVDYLANDAFPAETHEMALDKLTMLVQQALEVALRAIVLPAQTVGVSTELPGVAPLNLLRWNAAGTALENAVPPEIATLADGAITDPKVSPIAGIQSSKLAYLQAGTNAVTRLVQTRLRQEVWAEDFGAVADYNEGTNTGTDNTAAFASAVAYLVSIGGGTLNLDSGKYMGRFDIRHPYIRIVGKGSWATTLYNVDNNPVISITNADRDVLNVGVHGLIIRNRARATWTSSDGISIKGPELGRNCDFHTFSDLYIFEMRHGIFMEGRTIWNHWERIRIGGSIQNALTVNATDNVGAQTFLNCRFATSAQYGVFLNSVGADNPTFNWAFYGCTIEQNRLNGVRITGTGAGIQAWLLSNCYFEENAYNIPAGGGGGLVRSNFVVESVANLLGLTFDTCTFYGNTAPQPNMDYGIYVNTGSIAGGVSGKMDNCRFGVNTVNDVFWPKGVVLGQAIYTSGPSIQRAAGSVDIRDLGAAHDAFTPTLTFGGAAVGMGYTQRIGRFLRIGNMVHFEIYVALNAKGSSTGTAVISGLPFATSAAPAALFPAYSVHADQLAAGVNTVMARTSTAGGTAIELSKFASGTATLLTDADFGNFSRLTISGFYFI